MMRRPIDICKLFDEDNKAFISSKEKYLLFNSNSLKVRNL